MYSRVGVNRGSYILTSAILFLFLIAIPAFAQLPTGTILGVVKDQSGAVVANSTITIKNAETGLTRTAETGDEGSYRVPALPVGAYEVTVSREGFQTATRKGLTLEVSQEAVVDFTLQVGSTGQTVVVTEEAPQVNTTNGSLGGLVNEDRVAELPLNGRNYVDLTLLQAGITKIVTVGTAAGQTGMAFSSNGAPIRSNSYLLDGASLTNALGVNAASAAGTTLGVDGIKEYKVVTNTFSAEYGMTMGSQMTIVSKGGTNQFHGDVFEFLRNASLDARNTFDYTYQFTGKRVPQHQRNNFGGAFGGPIKKDKTFFFGVYEGLKENFASPPLDQVPNAACHVATGNPCATSASNPTGTVAPVMVPFLALYPTPNITNNATCGLTTGACTWSFPDVMVTDVNYGQMRVDHNFSASDSFFTRYTIDDSTQIRPRALPPFADIWRSRNQFLTVSENHVFSTALLNTARLSFSRTNLGAKSNSGLNGANYSFISGFDMGGISINGNPYTGIGPDATSASNSQSPPTIHLQNIYTFSDDVFYTKGRHSLKFGTLMNRFQIPIQENFFVTGSITFPNAGSFYAGQFSGYSSATPGSNFNRFYLFPTFGFYAQDDFRASSRLMVNLGLRYEFNGTPYEANGRGLSFPHPETDTTSTVGPPLRNPSLHNFSPRVGFAYDLTGKGKTSLRGGGGLYYDLGNIASAIMQGFLGTPPLASLTTLPSAPSPAQVLTLPFTTIAGFSGNVAKTLRLTDYNSKQPTLAQWNLTIDQQLPFGMALSVGYVGTRGYHLYQVKEGNPVVPSGFTNGIPFWSPTAYSAQCATNVTIGQAYNGCFNTRVNPAWSNITFITTQGASWYQGLQLQLTKRASHGLQFQSTYTWSKAEDMTQGQLPNDGGGAVEYSADTRLLDKGPSAFDTTHNWRFNTLYHAPTIQSQNFLGKMANGWWFGNIVSLQTGYPFSPLLGVNRSLQGAASATDRPNLGPTFDINSVYVKTPAPNGVLWINPAMFSMPAPGTLGNASRNMLRGPGMFNWDFSINKDTRLAFLGEAGNLQFRAEFFNLLNHPNLALPNATLLTLANSSPATLTNPSAPTIIPGTAGLINATIPNNQRQIQLALKLVF